MNVEGTEFGAVALSAAARDLTAPLVLLRQLSFQLDAQLGADEQPATVDALRQIRLTIGRTFEVADQLKMAVAGIDSLSLEPVQLIGLCQELGQELRPLSHELDCRLDFELPSRRCGMVAVGNYQALKTVLNGFLSDALYYSQPQGNSERLVRVRLRAADQQSVQLTIQDDGPGFGLEKALAMAANSNVVNPITSRPLMGSLNLLLADKLVRAMHGRITVHNRRQGGVVIETSLPASRQLSLLGDGV